MPPHRVRPGRNDDARLSAVARQKIRGSRQGAKNAKPLRFLCVLCALARYDFSPLKDLPLLRESELIVWKARTHFLQEIFCSASNRVARRGDTKAQFANQTGSRGSSSSTRRTYTSPEAAPGASLRLIDCLILDTAVLLIYQ